MPGKDQQMPHLQVGKPKYQQNIDDIEQCLQGKSPDIAAVFALLKHIAQEQHEIKTMIRKLVEQ